MAEPIGETLDRFFVPPYERDLTRSDFLDTFGKCEIECAVAILATRALKARTWRVYATEADMTGEDGWGFRLLVQGGGLVPTDGGRYIIHPSIAGRANHKILFPDQPRTWCCRLGWFHEVGCPHRSWSKVELKAAGIWLIERAYAEKVGGPESA